MPVSFVAASGYNNLTNGRVDLGLALQSGRRPVFYRQSMPSGRYFFDHNQDRAQIVSSDSTISNFIVSLDNRVVSIWKDLKQFTQICNLAHQTGYKLRRETYIEALTSILYRLLQLSVEDSLVDEALRLGMATLASNLFQRRRDNKQDTNHLRGLLDNALQKLGGQDHDTRGVPDSILFWLVVQRHMLSLNGHDNEPDGSLFRELVGRVHLSSWDEARGVLKSALWIDVLNDPQGRAVFEAIKE